MEPVPKDSGAVRQSSDFGRRNFGPAMGAASGREYLEPDPFQRSWQGSENNRVDQPYAESSGYIGFQAPGKGLGQMDRKNDATASNRVCGLMGKTDAV